MGEVPGYPNLKPWPKGVSGNPAGRPKRPSFEALVQAELDKRGQTGVTKREELARQFVEMLETGGMREMRELLARVWPEVKAQKVEVEPTRSFTIGWRGDRVEVAAEPESPEDDDAC